VDEDYSARPEIEKPVPVYLNEAIDVAHDRPDRCLRLAQSTTSGESQKKGSSEIEQSLPWTDMSPFNTTVMVRRLLFITILSQDQ